MIAVALVITTIALALQLVAVYGLAPRLPVGDEREYLSRARARDALAPLHFLRPPVLPWVAAVCHGGSASRTEGRLRLFVALTSVAAVAVTTVAGWTLGGGIVAGLAGTFLLLHPERILLGCHIWPDSPLALLIATVNLALLSPQPDSLLWLLGLGTICALGALTRIDFLVVPPAIPLALSVMGLTPTVAGVCALLAPTGGLLLLLSLRNAGRYAVPLPENTWAFNLMVSAAEVEHVGRREFALEPLISAVWTEWSDLSHEERHRKGLRALGTICRAPWRFARTVGRRLLATVGPDTFVTQKMLDPPGVYPAIGPGRRRLLVLALRIATPLLVSVAVVGLWVTRPPVAYAIPSLLLLGVSVLFHTRTRYRLVVLPTLSLVAAQGVAGAVQTPHVVSLVLPLAVLALLFVLLRRITSGREVPLAGSSLQRQPIEAKADLLSSRRNPAR